MRSISFNNLIHPLMFAIFPFIFFLSQNPIELSITNVLLPGFVTVSVAGIVFVLIIMFLRNAAKSAIITSFLLVFFFSYGYVYDALSGVTIAGVAVGRARYVLPLYILAMLAVTVSLIMTRYSLRPVRQFLNTVAVILVLTSAVSVGAGLIKREAAIFKPESADRIETSAHAQTPDIYYIILDAYANEKTLAELYGYDNLPFLSGLEERGFYVADKSTSNYAETSLSIASSLNMEYINYLSDVVADRENEFDPRVELIQNSAVSRRLRERGYTFITFRSPWGKLGSNPYADVNLQGGKFDELAILLVNTTLLRAGLLYPPFHEYIFSDWRDRILYIFEQLSNMPKRETMGPKFVFAHILSPHPPFIFGPNGEEVRDATLNFNPDDTMWGKEGRQRYLDQITFLNSKVNAMVEQILAASEDNQPIIVIQSDHGPWSTINEQRSTGRFYRERMRILNAYYLPNAQVNQLYESITPVNSFRVIFNNYFDANLPLLADINYYSNSIAHPEYPKTPYQFTDVTEEVINWDN
ncbi:MAG: sulfatase-like hydrolase/transferase [bacterium]|nr:sulfatase-like hydrolase/transferase [bacterium]